MSVLSCVPLSTVLHCISFKRWRIEWFFPYVWCIILGLSNESLLLYVIVLLIPFGWVTGKECTLMHLLYYCVNYFFLLWLLLNRGELHLLQLVKTTTNATLLILLMKITFYPNTLFLWSMISWWNAVHYQVQYSFALLLIT